MFKKIFDQLLIFLAGTLGAAVLWSWSRSLRWQRVGLSDEAFARHKGAGVLAFWHGQQLMAPWFHDYLKRYTGLPQAWVLISAHRDGRMIAKAVSWFGIKSIAGSSTRGGKEALLTLQAKLKAGGAFAVITPDGPRGPIHQSKPGVIAMAQRCAVPIYPIAFAYKKYWRFKSWDKMILPHPFSKAFVEIAEPIFVPATLAEEEFTQYQKQFDQTLNQLCERLDTYCRENA